MPRNDEGEFELVLGNRQLLSVFFVVIILLGVCFAAGYIIGRNSAGGPAAARAQGGERAIVVDPTAGEKSGGAPGAAPPSRPAPTAGAPESAAAAKTAPAKPAAEPPPADAKPTTVADYSVAEPASGQTYLQVAAVKRPDADTLVGELRKREFNAVVAPGPNETLFRVLVGPIKDSGELNQHRTRLKELGFDPLVKRY